MTHYKSETVFSLFAMLASRRYDDAVDILATLLASQENIISIIAGMVYQIKNAIRIKQNCIEGMSIKSACMAVGVRGGYTAHNQYGDFIAHVPLLSLQKMLCVCQETDATVREGYTARYQNLLVSKMMYDIIAKLQSSEKCA